MYACNLIYIIYSTIFPLYLGYPSPLPIIAMNNSVELTLQHSIFRSFDLKILWNPPELKPALYFTFSTSIFVQRYFISCWLLQFKTAFKENHCYVALPNLSFPTNHNHKKSPNSSWWGIPLGAQTGMTDLMGVLRY